MSGKTLIVSIFVFIFITLVMWDVWENNPRTIPDVNLQAKEQCIKNNGVPIDDSDNRIVDCRTYPVYIKVKPTVMPMPIVTISPTQAITVSVSPVIYNASSSASPK